MLLAFVMIIYVGKKFYSVIMIKKINWLDKVATLLRTIMAKSLIVITMPSILFLRVLSRNSLIESEKGSPVIV